MSLCAVVLNFCLNFYKAPRRLEFNSKLGKPRLATIFFQERVVIGNWSEIAQLFLKLKPNLPCYINLHIPGYMTQLN